MSCLQRIVFLLSNKTVLLRDRKRRTARAPRFCVAILCRHFLCRHFPQKKNFFFKQKHKKKKKNSKKKKNPPPENIGHWDPPRPPPRKYWTLGPPPLCGWAQRGELCVVWAPVWRFFGIFCRVSAMNSSNESNLQHLVKWEGSL